MRASPAVQVGLNSYAMWRGAVFVLAGLSTFSLSGWMVLQAGTTSYQAISAAGLLALATIGFGVSLARVPAHSLRWDGQTWHLGPLSQPGDEPVSGTLTVSLDLGAWMLLRFVAKPRPRPWSVTWLPVQRRGLESQWHALRCAAYSPRSGPGDAPQADL